MVSVRSPRTLRTIPFLIAACFLALPAHAKYSGGTGEPNDPYQIATAADLIALGDTPEDYDKHFILTADIDLDPNLPGRKVFDKAVIAPDVNDTEPWFQGTSFSGVFDGNGHTVSHLTIKGQDFAGLFGHLKSEAEVKNLGVVNVNITGLGWNVGGLVGGMYWGAPTVTECYSTGAVSGTEYVGGLVGLNDGGTVTECHSTAVVKGKSDVGGLVGLNEGTVVNCYSTGVVRGTSGDIGGLVGDNYCGMVIDCYSTGAVSGGAWVGGLVGSSQGDDVYTYARVTGCYSTGTVSGTEYVGGLVGYSSCGFVTRCYSTGTVSGTDCVGGLVGGGDAVDCWSTGAVRGTGKMVGGLVGSGSATASFWDVETSGQTTSAGGAGKTTAQMQDPNTFMAAGWDFVGDADGPDDVWAEPSGGGYPILCWQLPDKSGLPAFAGGTGEPNNPYRISTAKELNSIGYNPRLMQCHFKVVADLDLTAVHFYPIGDFFHPYGGTFDGNGRTVSHLTIKGTEGGYFAGWGMFGCLAGEIEKLGIVDANITASSYSNAGALVAYNDSSGSVTQCYSTGAVGGHTVGGLVGENYGTVAQCYSTCTVSRNTGWSSGGGLVGWNLGDVIQCYSTGGSSMVGVVGSGDHGRRTACFWLGGWTSKTQMQTASTFLDAGWDFVGETANGTEDVWKIAEGLDYPRLWWEPYDGRVTVVPGQISTVTLESNPSTGYRWEWVDHQDSIVEQIGEAQFKPRETDDPPLVGAGGWESFDFKAVHQGQMTLKLVYRRPWEEGVEPLKTFSLQVTVP